MGGIGKGHLIREIDALGGLMARTADASALHFRVLNKSKGEAVHGPRAQIDRNIYRVEILKNLRNTANLNILIDRYVILLSIIWMPRVSLIPVFQ